MTERPCPMDALINSIEYFGFDDVLEAMIQASEQPYHTDALRLACVRDVLEGDDRLS